jgi:malate dehydrogenase
VCVVSDGSYGVKEGLISSFPVTSDGKGNWEIVRGLKIDAFMQEKIAATVKELEMERTVVADLLK